MNILDTPVTVFNHVTDKTGTLIPLGEFLRDTAAEPIVKQIRATTDKKERTELKRQLRCAVIAAECPDGRKTEDTFKPTGLICIDIDGQDNPDFQTGEDLKSEVCKITEVAYCSLSASGAGCFAIMRLSNPEQFGGHFKALVRLFKLRLSINIDTQCCDLNRLRYATSDDAPYLNEDAPVFRIIDAAKVNRKIEISVKYDPFKDFPDDKQMSTLERVEACVREIERRHLDVTNGYDNWRKVGMALTDIGTWGREYFHRLSRMSPEYNPAKTDSKYTNLERTTMRTSIGTFFHVCKEHGIEPP